MSIKVNSDRVDWVNGETIAELLRRMNYIYPMLVIKMDGVVIPRSRYTETKIPDGCTLEIIHLESGG
jgi:sulfur carrier protein